MATFIVLIHPAAILVTAFKFANEIKPVYFIFKFKGTFSE